MTVILARGLLLGAPSRKKHKHPLTMCREQRGAGALP
jgi:hypothetical protein